MYRFAQQNRAFSIENCRFPKQFFEGTREQTNFEGICGKAAIPEVQVFSQLRNILFSVYSFGEARNSPIFLLEVAVIK